MDEWRELVVQTTPTRPWRPFERISSRGAGGRAEAAAGADDRCGNPRHGQLRPPSSPAGPRAGARTTKEVQGDIKREAGGREWPPWDATISSKSPVCSPPVSSLLPSGSASGLGRFRRRIGPPVSWLSSPTRDRQRLRLWDSSSPFGPSGRARFPRRISPKATSCCCAAPGTPGTQPRRSSCGFSCVSVGSLPDWPQPGRGAVRRGAVLVASDRQLRGGPRSVLAASDGEILRRNRGVRAALSTALRGDALQLGDGFDPVLLESELHAHGLLDPLDVRGRQGTQGLVETQLAHRGELIRQGFSPLPA